MIKKHPSRPFNPDIANTFFRAGLIEAWGRGTLKIINECKKKNLPIPKFDYKSSGFLVELYTDRLKLVKKSSGKSSGKILAYIQENPGITIPELAEKLQMTSRGIEKQIAKLKTLNKIKRIGPAKGGYWKIIND